MWQDIARLNDEAQFAQHWTRDGDTMVLDHEVAPGRMLTYRPGDRRPVVVEHHYEGGATFEDMDVAVQIGKYDLDGELVGVLRAGKPTLRDGLLVNGGGNWMAKALREASVASGNQPDTTVRFNNSNARIGVGDNTTAAAVAQTQLQASTNVLLKAMNTGFPLLVDQTYDRPNPTTGATETVTVSARQIVFQSVFAGSDANFQWVEMGVFNGGTNGTSLMLDRLILGSASVYGGTKPSTPQHVWIPTLTLTLS